MLRLSSLTRVALTGLSLCAVSGPAAAAFNLPTANRALFQTGAETKFFAPTAGKTWQAGTYGCVRSDGWQMHEGLDILAVRRDARGEPLDPVLATAAGTVCYLNRKPSLSSYGNYVILRHLVDGLEIYSLYAHLADIREGLKHGQTVQAGETLGTLGRTANTRERIGQERAHLHFELALLANDRFSGWYRKYRPGQRDDHGAWNGQNFLAFDGRQVLLLQAQMGASFNLLAWLRAQPPLCRVLIRQPDLALVQRYPALQKRNPVAEQEGVAGYELALNFAGVPCEVIPRAASEIKSPSRYQLLSVSEAEQQKHPCRRLVTKKSGRWQLAPHGEELLTLLAWR
jgi:murein DD-endopeptidase MepM/ murein hydrolase activator NlpD